MAEFRLFAEEQYARPIVSKVSEAASIDLIREKEWKFHTAYEKQLCRFCQ